MRIVMEEAASESEKECIEETKEQVNKTFRQKMRYFWDYHKWKVIIPLIILVFGISIIISYRQEKQELTLYIAMMNAHMDDPDDADFVAKYVKDLEIDAEALPVRIETGLYHPKPEMNGLDEVSAASVQKYRALLLSGKADVTITTSWVIDEYESAGCYLDLEDVLPSSFYASLENKIYYAADENGKEVPVGIYVDQTKTMEKYYEDERPIITISAFSGRVDESVEFVMWLLAN